MKIVALKHKIADDVIYRIYTDNEIEKLKMWIVHERFYHNNRVLCVDRELENGLIMFSRRSRGYTNINVDDEIGEIKRILSEIEVKEYEINTEKEADD